MDGFKYWCRVCWRRIRGISALIVGAVLSSSIIVMSIVIGVIYNLTLIGPIRRHKKGGPHPLLRLSVLHNAVLWHVCYKWILGMRFDRIDITPAVGHLSIPKQQFDLPRKAGVLKLTCSRHPDVAMLFPHCYFEQRNDFWSVITVKWEQLLNPLGWAGAVCGAFVFLVRAKEEGYLRMLTRWILEFSVQRYIKQGVRLIVFGDAHRFSEKRQAELRDSEKDWLSRRARALQYVLPERYAGMHTLLETAESLDAEVDVRVSTLFTNGPHTTSFFQLHKLVGCTIFMFTTQLRMDAEHLPEQMRGLWDEFENIGKNPAHYVTQLRSGALRRCFTVLTGGRVWRREQSM